MKKATRANKLAVGAFALLAALLLVAATLFFGPSMALFRHTSRYFTTFKSAAGLHVGAAVKMGGVDIGTVESIAIDTSADSPSILLTMVIYGPNEELIKANSVVSLDTQGMLGDKVLNLSTGTGDAPNLPPGNFLKANESTDMATVVTQSTDIIKTVGETVKKLDTFVDSLPDSVTMRKTAGDFGASAEQLKGLLGPLNAARLDATLVSLQSAAQHLDSVAAKIDSGQGALGALVNDPALYDDMRTLLGRANRSKSAKFIIREMLNEKGDAAAH